VSASNCPNGHTVEEGHRFCPACGAEVSTDAVVEPSESAPITGKRKWAVPLAIGLAALFVGGIAVGLLNLGTGTPPESQPVVNPTQGLPTAEEQCQDEMESWLNYLIENGDPALNEMSFTFGTQSREGQFLMRLYGDTLASSYQVGIDQTRIDVVWPRIIEFCAQIGVSNNSDALAGSVEESNPPDTQPPTTPNSVARIQPDGCTEDTSALMPGEAAVCLYHYWQDHLRTVPIGLATSAAVEQIFEEPYTVDLLLSGCEEWLPDWPSSVCEFIDEAGSVSVQMYLYPSAGGAWYVDSVGFDGIPPVEQSATTPAGLSPEECPQEPTPGSVVGEQAARCLYHAWSVDDHVLARAYASDEAIEDLFEFPSEPSDWEWGGCDVSCVWLAPGVWVDMFMGSNPDGSLRVEEILFSDR